MPPLQRVAGLTLRDFLRSPVPFVIRIGNVESVVTIGVDFQHRGTPLGPRAVSRGGYPGARFIGIGVGETVPIDGVCFGAFGEAVAERGGPGDRGSHRVAVVFDEIDYGKVEQTGEVEHLVISPGVHGAVSEETNDRSGFPAVDEAKGKPGGQRRLAAGRRMAAPVAEMRGVKSRGTRLALRAAFGDAHQLGHARLHLHPRREGVAHPAETRNRVVQRPHHRPGARRHRFLADAQEQPSANFITHISLQRHLFETADPDHHAQEIDLPLVCPRAVDRMIAKVHATPSPPARSRTSGFSGDIPELGEGFAPGGRAG